VTGAGNRGDAMQITKTNTRAPSGRVRLPLS